MQRDKHLFDFKRSLVRVPHRLLENSQLGFIKSISISRDKGESFPKHSTNDWPFIVSLFGTVLKSVYCWKTSSNIKLTNQT